MAFWLPILWMWIQWTNSDSVNFLPIEISFIRHTIRATPKITTPFVKFNLNYSSKKTKMSPSLTRLPVIDTVGTLNVRPTHEHNANKEELVFVFKKKNESGTAGLASVGSADAIEKTQWTKYGSKNGGHGFAAEDANALNEKLRGRNVEKVGLSNEPNGADRITDGKMIQTKYYNSAAKSVDAGFDAKTGIYRYKGQVLEVPSDQYDEALVQIKKRISEGSVPGQTDPEKAVDLIKKGDVTYAQARNIAKAGNIDSLWFDFKNQVVVTSFSFGISFVIQYANGIWNGLDAKIAFKNAFCNALKTGAVVLIAGIGTQQLLRTSVGRSFASFTTNISRGMISKIYGTKVGKDLIEKLASAIMKKALYGAAAKNAVSKLMRSNIVTSTVTAIVLTAPDAYKAIISKRISAVQFSKNLASTVSGIAGGMGGAWGGAAVGAALGTAVPVIGNAIGALAGGIVGGLFGGLAAVFGTKKIADAIAQDDSEIMIESLIQSIQELSFDYLLTDKEVNDEVMPVVVSKLDAKLLQEMYCFSGGRGNTILQIAFAKDRFENVFEDVLRKRPKIITPSRLFLGWMSFKTKILLIFIYLKMKILMLFKVQQVQAIEAC